jgi:hypothetical protein
MTDDDDDLRALLGSLDPKARDDLRRVLIRDHADRICKLYGGAAEVRVTQQVPMSDWS